jgi:hypothetical protein
MVDDPVGLRNTQPRELPLWIKLFSGFKVALDPKKLLLAAAGIVVMSIGWWLLSVLFFSMRGGLPPQWSDYSNNPNKARGETPQEKKETAWRTFRHDRRSWNLLYAMAAPLPDIGDGKPDTRRKYSFDVGDLAETPEEYEAIEKAKNLIEDELRRLDKPIQVVPDVGGAVLKFGGQEVKVKAEGEEKIKRLQALAKDDKLVTRDLAVVTDDKSNRLVRIHDVLVMAEDAKDLESVEKYIRGAKTVDQIKLEAKDGKRNEVVTLKALKLLEDPQLRPAGQFRTWPWIEYRGPNPFLLATGNVKHTLPDGSVRHVPWERGAFLTWFFTDEVPVLLEPLVKFLRPVVYLLDPAGGVLNRIYLILIILWTLATWALFGGAITRMAAVQVARTNEKIGMTEALRFAKARVQGYFSAPLLPLVFLAILTVFLWLYGLVGTFTWFFGDIVVYGLFAPIMFLIGLIMAVVLVGLVGWPLMYSTISTEGSDSFDAISRSYSYVYQAPWHYLWYSAVALVYGAVLVFFVGLMGSLMVYMGKWGISQVPGQQMFDREPTYLFVYAPPSFGWRDLLLENSPGVVTVPVAHSDGTIGFRYQAAPNYDMRWNNYLGAWLVTLWLGILFLMVVGFGFSYFWSASTIIYLLMRRKIDDTELDEIHLEEEDLEEPYPAAAGTAAAPPGPVGKPEPAAPPVTMVESPTLRAPSAATPPAAGAAPKSEGVGAPTATEAVVSRTSASPATASPAPSAPGGGNQERAGPTSAQPHTRATNGPTDEDEKP